MEQQQVSGRRRISSRRRTPDRRAEGRLPGARRKGRATPAIARLRARSAERARRPFRSAGRTAVASTTGSARRLRTALSITTLNFAIAERFEAIVRLG